MFAFTILGGYVFFSVFFLKYPHLIHKKKCIRFVARNVSHRGGAREYYENTVKAFKRSLLAGSDMLELDCHITKDGKVVVVHDNNLQRLTGVDVNVTETNYMNLPSLKTEISVDFGREGDMFKASEPQKDLDLRIPLLEDVFLNFPEVPINIDIKIDNDDLVKGVNYLIQKYKREELCVWGNIKYHITEKCYRENPNVNLLFSRKRVSLLVLLYYTGLLPFFPIKETHLEIFLPSIYESKWVRKHKHPTLANFALKAIDFLLIRKSIFEHLRKRGIQTYLWVLNSNEEFDRAFRLGVTGVMTDCPKKLSEFIAKNPQCFLFPDN